jgi:acyl-CoA thioesterase-1
MGTVIFLGDSLTAGHGLPASQAYPALVQQRISAAGLPFDVVNAGVSGDTTAGGLRRIDWLLRRRADVLVIALGANDGLRGVSLEETERNLRSIIARAREKNPEIRILLAGMKVPPNLGIPFAAGFRGIYPRVARDTGVALWPFMLEGVAGDPDLNQDDGIHPNASGQQIIAGSAWKHLRPLLEEGR